MAYGSEEDLVREYEMIWTLFHGKEEQEEAEARKKASGDPPCPCTPKDGIAVRLLKFLFGSDPDDCESYHEKRPYHRHIYQPAPRSRDRSRPLGTADQADNLKPTDISTENQHIANNRLYAESALVTRPPLDMPGPGAFLHPPLPGQRSPFCERLLRLLAVVIIGAAVVLATSAGNGFRHIKSFLFGAK